MKGLNDILSLQDVVDMIKTNRKKDIIVGESQNLRDKEILDFIGENLAEKND